MKLGFRKYLEVPGAFIPNSLNFKKGVSDDRVKLYISDTSGTGFKVGIQDESEVRNTPLTGFSVGANAAIAAADNILQAFEKAQGQINNLSSAVASGIKVPMPLNASANPNYPAAQAGDSYYITVAGKVGGASGLDVREGDKIIALQNNSGGTQAQVGANWYVVRGLSGNATTTTNGVGRIATLAEAVTGSDNFAWITSAVLASRIATREPAFTKNTGFNRNFGTAANTVAQGNDSRIVNGQTAFGWGNHVDAGYAIIGTAGGQVRNNTALDARYQAILSNPVTGIGTSGQVAFWTGAGTQGGDSGLVWFNSEKRLAIIGNQTANPLLILSNYSNGVLRQPFIELEGSSTFGAVGNNIRITCLADGANGSSAIGFSNRSGGGSFLLRWSILSSGILQSNGAQTIETSEGALTLQGNGGDLNYNAPNGQGDYVTLSSNSFRRRTAAQVREEIMVWDVVEW
ncbi:hypothetical protein MM236_19195 [Belliella sp. DSM 107340]|uniref:Tail fiber protein n=1 Tax=Belliella calami TaxID=2923436 RepID=A0ABS9UU31_9BACT|nr:hypothetical protein [Belliella calami]MCH7400130.1 hypothetical protein [Belliella calami]